MHKVSALNFHTATQPATLVSVLQSQASRYPERTILRFVSDDGAEDLCLTYAQLDSGARTLARTLQQLGAVGERAILMHSPGPDYVMALLGCLYAGVVAVPAYPPRFNRPMHRLRDIVLDAGARFALTSQQALTRINSHLDQEPALAALHWLATDQVSSLHTEPLQEVWPAVDAQQLALLQYTSGSTSSPKGVMLSHSHFLSNIVAMARALGISAEDRMVSWLPPYHDMGLVGALLTPLCVGMETTLLTPTAFLQRPYRWLAAISQQRATVSGGPNFGYELCVRRVNEAQRQQLDLSSWRIAFSGAERVRATTLQQFASAFAGSGFQAAAFTPCYGLAEATLGVSFALGVPRTLEVDDVALGRGQIQPVTAPNTSPVSLVSCGRPVPDCEVLVVNPDTCLKVPADQVGELWLHSPGVAAGYWRKPELSAQVFHARLADAADAQREYLRTGDLGFIRDGEVYVLGRLKDLIILRGVNYYPEDIESVVEASHPALRPAGAVAFSVDRDGEEQLVLVQELIPGARDLSLPEIASAIREAVAESAQLLVHDVLLVGPGGVPRTSSGKVQRNRCRELYLQSALDVLHGSPVAAAVEVAAPQVMIDQLALLMAELLGVESLSSDDDFFWLGGHSLLATQLASRVRDLFQVELPLRALFEASTPRRLAARIINLPKMAVMPEITPVDRSAKLPLAFSQERMWFLHQLDPQGTAYNVAGAVQIDGELQVALLSAAFDEVLRRHEVLRTRYASIDGMVDLRIMPPTDLNLLALDLRQHPEPVVEAMRRATVMVRSPFDIANESLIRIELYRVDHAQHVLSVCMHHLVTDAWSMGIMVSEMLRFYDALSAGQPLPPAAAGITYVDYAQWQRHYLSGPRAQIELDYWKQQVQGAEAVELPADRPRTTRRSSIGALEPLQLPAELMASLGSFATAHGATTFMVMLAAFEALLYRWTGRSDLVVGVPVANRNWRQSEALMGTLVNTLPVRVQFGEDISFAQLLRIVRERSLDAYAHQDLPFERLISELNIERKAGSSPLVSVMFDYQNAPMPGRRDGALTMRPMFLSRGSSQFDLSLLILDTEFGRVAGIEYSTDLFDAQTIKRFLGHYLSVLETAVLRPDEAIARIPLLSDVERHELLSLAHASCHEAPAIVPLVQRFAAQMRQTPAAPAVFDQQGQLSYAELDQRVQQLSARLIELGVGPGKRVAVCLDRSRHLVVALLATLHAGGAYVPLDPHHPQDRLGYVLEDAQPELLLTESHLESVIAMAGSAQVLCLDQLVMSPVSADVAADQREPVVCDESLAAYIIYTSGSTGRPKGVEVSRRALANFIYSMQHTPGITPADRLLSVTTVAFDIAGLELYLPLVSGASVYVAGSEVVTDGPRLAALMRSWQASFMQATPATWKMLIEAGWRGHAGLKVLCGGEAFPRELAEELLLRAGSVWNMYGPTETTVWSTVQQVRSTPGALVPIGAAIDETSIYILDRHLQLAPKGVAGEIFIGGVGVANGYYRREELTRERFVADPFMREQLHLADARMYRTGDAGRLRSDGTLEHLGRLDDQIKIRGFRIEPGEIEQVLKEHSGVRDALVLAREVRPGDLRLIAYYVPVDSKDVSGLPLASLLEPLRRKLPAYMIPSAFVALAAFPQTPNGKIDRRALPSPPDTASSDEEYVAPRDELETGLAQLWQSLLQVTRVGIRDSFFMLGGHSLLAVRLFAGIERRFGVVLPMAILFERPTIEFLAEAIREKSSSEAPPAAIAAAVQQPADIEALPDFHTAGPLEFVVPIQTRGYKPVLFGVHGAGGNVLNFWSIAHYMGIDRPFFGVQARGVDGIGEPLRDIPQMAELYLAELRRVQPHGPYYLSGYCAGGWIAYEMARLLVAQGETVAMLAMLDCYHPRLQSVDAPLRNLLQSLGRDGLSYLWRKAPQSIGRYASNGWCKLQIALHRWLQRPVPLELREFWLINAMNVAAARYQPQGYAGDLVLLRATDIDPQLSKVGPNLGWDGLARHITVLDVPGNHHTLAQEPNVARLAATLLACLRNAMQAEQ